MILPITKLFGPAFPGDTVVSITKIERRDRRTSYKTSQSDIECVDKAWILAAFDRMDVDHLEFVAYAGSYRATRRPMSKLVLTKGSNERSIIWTSKTRNTEALWLHLPIDLIKVSTHDFMIMDRLPAERVTVAIDSARDVTFEILSKVKIGDDSYAEGGLRYYDYEGVLR